MILVVEKSIDLTTYLQIAFLHGKRATTHVSHISWSLISVPKNFETLYLVGHGGGGYLGSYKANDLAAKVISLGLLPTAKKIVLSGCHTGAKQKVAEETIEAVYADVFLSHLKINYKDGTIPPIVAFASTSFTMPDGRKRIANPEKKTDRTEIITKAFEGKKKDKDLLSAKVLSNAIPSTSEGLIRYAQETAREYLKLVNGGADTWEKIWGTLLSSEESKVYLNSPQKVHKPKTFDANLIFK